MTDKPDHDSAAIFAEFVVTSQDTYGEGSINLARAYLDVSRWEKIAALCRKHTKPVPRTLMRRLWIGIIACLVAVFTDLGNAFGEILASDFVPKSGPAIVSESVHVCDLAPYIDGCFSRQYGSHHIGAHNQFAPRDWIGDASLGVPIYRGYAE